MDNKYTNNNIFKTTECPSDALLLSYVKETISKEDKRLVELHLIDCEMCNDMVEGFQAMRSSNIDSNIKSIEIKIEEAVAAHNNKKGASSFKWYYAVAAILIIGITGILYNFYFDSLDQTKVADLPMPHQNEISAIVDTGGIVEEAKPESNENLKKIKAVEPLQTVAPIQNKRDAVQEESIALSESSMNEAAPAPVEQKMEEKSMVADDAEIPTKSLTDNTTFGTTTIAQPAFSGTPNTEVITNGATPYFTSPSNNLSTVNIKESDSKKLNFSLKKESSGKSKFKANAPTAVSKEEAKDKQEDLAAVEKTISDTTNIIQKANLLLQQKKYNEALAKFNQYVKTHPKSCEAINGLAQCYDATNKTTEAIIYYVKLSQLKCGKQSDAAYLKLGELYSKNKQPNEAKQVLQKALQSKYLDIAEQAKKELDKL